jgi:hypothetical protein
MRGLFGMRACVAAVVVAAVGTAGVAVDATAQRGSAAASVAGAPGTEQAAEGRGAERTLMLPDGERFAVSPGLGSGGVLAGLPGSSAGPVESFSLGGRSYLVPADAVPYLGHGLDPALFDVRALLRAERAGRLPVRVSYRGHIPALPGVTVTGAARGQASGYLTAASARRFGAALAAQYLADRPRASYGADGLFGGGASVSLAGSPAAARAPRSPAAGRGSATLVTLTVRGTNRAGKPDTGDQVFVVNIDNSNLTGGVAGSVKLFKNGTASFGVPAGHYLVLGSFLLFDGPKDLPQSFAGDMTTVVPQVTVSRDTTVKIAARAATSKVTMVTPRPAKVLTTTFTLHRVPVSGPVFSFITGSGGNRPVWISPTSMRPSRGNLQTVTAQFLSSPAGTALPYFYNLSYQDLDSGTIHRQRYLIHPSSVATVRDNYVSATKLRSAPQFAALYPMQANDFLLTPEVVFSHMPSRDIMFVPGIPSLAEFTALTRVVMVNQPFPGLGFFLVQSAEASYRAGERVTRDWNGYPLYPAPDPRLPSFTAPVIRMASATRTGNVLTMLLTPFSDNTPGGQGSGFGLVDAPIGLEPGVTYAGTFAVDQNGVKVAGGDATKSLTWQATLGAKSATIRFTLDAAKISQHYPLSDHSDTVWTWRSAASSGARLPAGWYCGEALPGHFTPRHNCAAQPLLTLNYHLARLGLTGQIPAGKQQQLSVSVRHMQPASTTAKITKVTVAVSFDGGKTFHPARVTGSDGSYRVTFTAPAGALVTLRTSATDTAGSSITETIADAYQIAH